QEVYVMPDSKTLVVLIFLANYVCSGYIQTQMTVKQIQKLLIERFDRQLTGSHVRRMIRDLDALGVVKRERRDQVNARMGNQAQASIYTLGEGEIVFRYLNIPIKTG
ncbi:unnamed protein product, partial [marine sediment metagenome]